MPWFKQGVQLPAELENMDPQALLDAVNKSKEVDTLKTQLTAAEGKLSEFDAVKSRLASLEANQPKPPARDPSEPPEPTSFLEDEDRAFAERHNRAITPILMAQVRSAKFQAKASLNAVDRKIWDKYEAEIDDVMKPVAVQYQAFPETWINALTTIKGRHFSDLQTMASEKSDVFAEEGGSSGRGGPAHEDVDAGILTDEDKRLAKRLGVSEAEYLESKKAMVIRADVH